MGEGVFVGVDVFEGFVSLERSSSCEGELLQVVSKRKSRIVAYRMWENHGPRRLVVHPQADGGAC